jgi:hypothetical protein
MRGESFTDLIVNLLDKSLDQELDSGILGTELFLTMSEMVVVFQRSRISSSSTKATEEEDRSQEKGTDWQRIA